jgi:hypothetical protein
VLGAVAGALWFVVEHRRVTRIDERRAAHPIVGRPGAKPEA